MNMQGTQCIKGNLVNAVSLMLILIGNICFYTTETILIYLAMCGIGIGLALWKKLISSSFGIRISHGVIWLTIVYTLYTIYGCFFLRAGTYNWDALLVFFIEGVCIYFDLEELLKGDKWQETIANCSLVTVLFTTCYLLYNEYSNIIDNVKLGSIRIGESLSGNVNTVGLCLGFMSVFLMQGYCITKKKKYFIVFCIAAVIMLLTGSKKAVIILGFCLLLYFLYEKRKLSGWLKILILFIIACYMIFGIKYFYNIIGNRIIAMVEQIFLEDNSANYSRSTDLRMQMIKEALGFFVDHPFFGGGMKYFYFRTATEYEYSHCNYAELLCNMGLIGAIAFYFPYFLNLFKLNKLKSINYDKAILGIIFITMALILDWMMVSYSDICVFYIPIIAAFAIVDNVKMDGRGISQLK